MEQDPGKTFFNDGYQLLQSEIKGQPTKDGIFRAIRKMYQGIDQLNDSLLNYAQKQGLQVACHKGCEWCCHQAVFANSYEVHYLSEHIKAEFPAEETKAIYQRAMDKNKKVSLLSEKEILEYKSPCALLRSGACSAYQARPMACRIYLSTKLQSCIDFFHHPEEEKQFPALLDFPLLAGRMMNEGFMKALKERGIETAEFRLEEGLSIILSENWSEPDALK